MLRSPERSAAGPSRRALAGALASAAVAVGGCGCGGGGPVAVRVATMSIEQSTIDHWASAFARGAAPAISVTSAHQPPRQRALAFLLTVDWLLGEAREQGLALSAAALHRRVVEQGESSIGGPGEFHARLAATGESRADAELEVKAQWAATEVRRLFGARADTSANASVGEAQVGDAYRTHIARYRVPELREFVLAEGFSNPAAASAFARPGTGVGSHFDRIAFHESAVRPGRFDEPGGKGPLLRAIFSARIGAPSAPMFLKGFYVVFVLRHVRPAYVTPFAAVRAAIRAHLVARSRRRAFAELLAAYDRRWTARTDCRSGGYVVQKCRQFSGARAPEDNSYLTNAGVAP